MVVGEALALEQINIVELRQKLGRQLVPAENVRTPSGLATGFRDLDQFLLWQGLPKGALSVFQGAPGLGATTVWMQTAATVTKQSGWCAWLSSEARLNPWALQRRGVKLEQLVVVSCPRDAQQRLWVLQEILSLGLFELVACDLARELFSDRQLVQLRQLTARVQAAVVLLTQRRFSNLSRFAFAAEFSARGVNVTRALHRLTPHFLPRRESYADLMPQLSSGGVNPEGSRTPSNGGNLFSL